MPKLRGLDELHGRLAETAKFLLDGLSNKEIANEMGIHVRAVKANVHRLRLHFDAPNRTNIAIKLFKATANTTGPVMPKLTFKQLTIANYVADGYSNRQIAVRTGCTYNTTRNTIKDLFDICGVWSRLELTLFILHHRGANSDANRN